ncbi:MAG: hypothetical protein J07HQW2_00456 [Haloquadratum walsbyi J07HQW2]|uniref:Uncharacterized protein n=1 Tax=Haloquadratum walsbyi J07HQW2 TaxID=1238425 RepID=U1PK26_9EURY|nr:MAG: hypothetical protein J07HQW2_00456 [Haloquadratum walsbyi J07HQW2]
MDELNVIQYKLDLHIITRTLTLRTSRETVVAHILTVSCVTTVVRYPIYNRMTTFPVLFI